MGGWVGLFYFSTSQLSSRKASSPSSLLLQGVVVRLLGSAHSLDRTARREAVVLVFEAVLGPVLLQVLQLVAVDRTASFSVGDETKKLFFPVQPS